MDYQTLKRNIIEQARRDPASFLYAMLAVKKAHLTAMLPPHQWATSRRSCM